MFILIGKAPDFLMRQGLVDVFHRGVVRVENDEGLETFHESTSDRSLWVVAKVLAGYLRANDVGKDEVKDLNFSNLHALFKKGLRKVILSISLPPQLADESRVELADNCAEVITRLIYFQVCPTAGLEVRI